MSLMIGYGCLAGDGLQMDGLEAWVDAFCERHPDIPLGCGGDVLSIVLASTDEEQVRTLGVVKLPDEGVLSLDSVAVWVPEERLDWARQQWEQVRREASGDGLVVLVGRCLFLVTEE